MNGALALVGGLSHLTDTTPPIDPTLFQPVTDGVTAEITAILPYGIGVLVLLAGIGIAVRLLRKFGVRS
jgi:hypothetical protein